MDKYLNSLEDYNKKKVEFCGGCCNDTINLLISEEFIRCNIFFFRN